MRVLNKRCMSTVTLLFFIFFSLILGLFFYFAVTLKVKAAVADTSYHKKFYSRDLALIVDSMHATNGKMVMEYEIYTKGKMELDTDLLADRVLITDYSSTPLDKRPQTYFRFGYNDRVKVDPLQISHMQKSFSIATSGDRLWFGNPYGGDIPLKEAPSSETSAESGDEPKPASVSQ